MMAVVPMQTGVGESRQGILWDLLRNPKFTVGGLTVDASPRRAGAFPVRLQLRQEASSS